MYSRLSKFAFSGKSLVLNKLQQISQKTLALRFNQQQLKPYLPLENYELMDALVPNFFAEGGNFKFFELKDEFKSTFPPESQMNTVTNTFLQLHIPIGSKEKLRRQFTKLNTNERVRIGRLLEVLDCLVALVSYRYCYVDLLNHQNRQMTIVTLSVNNFIVHSSNILTDQDLTLNSYMIYAGKSSMLVQADLYQKPNDDLVASVTFLMVARDVNDYTKAFQVPSLEISRESLDIRDLTFLRQELGKEQQNKRIGEYSNSLQRNYPNDEESEILHKLFLTKATGERLDSTIVKKQALMHTQERNVHGRVFGGYMMREIMELGWLAGYRHTKGQMMQIQHIFDVVFLSPVPVGSVTDMTARIVYVEANMCIVQVKLSTMTFEGGKENNHLCTEVYMALEGVGEISPVIPHTYEEGVAYLCGRRHFKKLQ